MKDADYLAGIAKRTLGGPDMNTTKHTPGPWHMTGSCPDGTMVTDEHGEQICIWPQPHKAVAFSNARLIAAAPKLLKAIRGLANWTMRDGTPCFCPVGVNEDEPKGKMPMIHSSSCEDARAAIAEAEGRE